METYRISSKINEQDKEYLIQTTNDANVGLISTTVYVNGLPAETVACPHPSEVSPQEILSLVKVNHGEKKKELELLLKAYRVITEKGDAKLTFQLGKAFFYKGFMSEAQQLFSSATTLDQESHQAYNYLGLTEMSLGRFNEAIVASRKAVSMRTSFADYHNNLGEIYLANNDHESGIKEFVKAIEVNLYYSDAYLNLGLAYLLESISHSDRSVIPEMQEKIKNCFHKASLIYAQYKGQKFDEGIACLEKSNFTRALTVFKTIRELKKETRRQEFASLHMKFVLHPDWVSDQVITDRMKYLENEITKNPSYVDLKTELAQCFLEQSRQNLQHAIEQYKNSVAINPSLSGVNDALSASEEALKVIDEVVDKIVMQGSA